MARRLVRFFLRRLVLLVLAATLSLAGAHAGASDLRGPVLKVTVKGGQFGVVDAAGRTRVPFIYDWMQQAGRGFFIVGVKDPKTPSAERRFGVVDDTGRVIVPPTWAGIEHNTRHGCFEVVAANDNRSQGILAEDGRVIVPAIYDRLERISNMGDEPTQIALRGGKFGYVHIVTGQVMIPVEYDVLRIGSTDVDAEGVGTAVAAKGDRWGVIATDGRVVVPFEYDAIGDLSGLDGSGIAERGGRLVRLDLRGGRFNGATEVANEYSSNFVPRPRVSLNAPAPDGLYAAEDVPTMRAAWDAWRGGKLHWVAIPSVQVDGNRVHVAFGQFRHTGLPALPNVLAAKHGAGGFAVWGDSVRTEGDPFLSFKVEGDVLTCAECASRGLPPRWHRVPPADAGQPFGGIGVGFSKASPAHPLRITEVLRGGPGDVGGLRSDDEIVRVDEADVSGYTAEQARAALRGAAGSIVRLQVLRDGQPLPRALVVERKAIDLRR